MKTYTIRPIVTGYTKTNKSTYIYHHSTHGFYDVEGFEELPVTTFLVEGDSKLIMIDTGMSCTEIAHKYHHPGSHQPEGYAIHEQLAKLGVNPADIDMVILTHLHWDHCYNLDKFTKAKFYVQREEYEFALNPIPLYYKSYEYPVLGLKPQFDGIKFELIDGEAEIIEGISVYPSPGHSVGHQTVVVNTAEGAYHCCGDAIFTNDNLKPVPQIHYSITPPGRFQNVVNSWKSIEDMKERAKEDRFILATHELSMDRLFNEGKIFGKAK
jgi:glyoxylase-like metal-dependent hydrolase (beta-lactamase superfamily II)